MTPKHKSSVPLVEIREASKQFGPVKAVQDVSFEVQEGEFFSLLGPSGCGKTTTLRMIAGFESPNSGSIWIGGKDVTTLAPRLRNIGMVFQDYALFPHMNVYENVAFGLRLRRMSRNEINNRVQKYLALVNLEGFEDRMVNQLSGGQQQRIALARALSIEPEVLLLDEPLGAMDRKLREAMEIELRQLVDKVMITTIFVTHDQDEALSMSDRVAVMNEGRLVQVGVPRDIYNRPANIFVADFIGTSNCIPGKVLAIENNDVIVESEWGFRLRGMGKLTPGQEVTCIIRPEKIRLSHTSERDQEVYLKTNPLTGKLINIKYLGDRYLYYVSLIGDHVIIVQSDTLITDESRVKIGQDIYVEIEPEDILFLG